MRGDVYIHMLCYRVVNIIGVGRPVVIITPSAARTTIFLLRDCYVPLAERMKLVGGERN